MWKDFIKELLPSLTIILTTLFDCAQSSSNPVYGFACFPPGTKNILGLSHIDIATTNDPATGIDLNFRELVIHNSDTPLQLWDEKTTIYNKIKPSQSMRFWINKDVLNFTPCPGKVSFLLQKRGNKLKKIPIKTQKSMEIKVKERGQILFLACEFSGLNDTLRPLFQKDGLDFRAITELPIKNSIRALLLTIGFADGRSSLFAKSIKTEIYTIARKWFNNSKPQLKFSEDSPTKTSSNQLVFTYPDLPILDLFNDLKIRTESFGIAMSPFSLVISSYFRIIQGQNVIYSGPEVFIRIQLEGAKVRIAINENIPYTLYFYRGEKLQKSWEFENFDGTVKVQENDMFVIYPIPLLWLSKFKANNLRRSSQSQTTDLYEILAGVRQIIITIKRPDPKEPIISSSNQYEAHFVWPKPTIFIRRVDWDQAILNFPHLWVSTSDWLLLVRH